MRWNASYWPLHDSVYPAGRLSFRASTPAASAM